MIKVIGAGLPRTATTTLMVALEQLGFAPCYHMRDLLADLEGGLPKWEAVADGKRNWDEIFGDAESTLDWPSARYWRELIEYYPEAKVVLSVRSAEGWIRSMKETVWAMYFGDSVLHHLCEARGQLDPLWNRYLQLMRRITWNEGTGALPEASDEANLAAAMERWNDDVRRGVPADRLLEWDPAEGWEPLCSFLGVETPADPLPRINDTVGFKEGIIGGALSVVNAWWEQRDRPDSGLHGASLS